MKAREDLGKTKDLNGSFKWQERREYTNLEYRQVEENWEKQGSI